jgi:hypothetical protein
VATATYDRLLGVVETYIGRAKAETTIGRQLPRCNATPETLTPAQVGQILNFICGAAKIHLAGDKARQQELETKLRALV